MLKLLRDPLVQFMILGVALFAYFNLKSEATAAPPDPGLIVMTEREVAVLIDQYEAVWRRPPTGEELQSLVKGYVEEEILVREALALGLDRNDAAIRARLRQKMLFLTDSAAQALEPGEEDLQAHLDANADQFQTPASLSFEHIFLGQTASPDEVADALGQLADGTKPETLGSGTLLPPSLSEVARPQVDGVFGTGFFEGLETAEPDIWTGPLSSGYGVHLVRVRDRVGEQPAQLENVRDKVLFDWRRVKSTELSAAQMAALRSRYEIEAPTAETLRGVLAQ